MKLFAHMMCCTVLMLLLVIPASGAASLQYQLEAAFLFNFTQFVEWPESAFAGNDSPLVIGVLGDDPFGSYLDEIVRGEVVNGHPLVVERYRNEQQIRHCQILFIANSESNSFQATLLALKNRNVLTVSNLEGFARAGGTVVFLVENSRLRLRINVNAVREARLVISSKLLKQAELVGRTEE